MLVLVGSVITDSSQINVHFSFRRAKNTPTPSELYRSLKNQHKFRFLPFLSNYLGCDPFVMIWNYILFIFKMLAKQHQNQLPTIIYNAECFVINFMHSCSSTTWNPQPGNLSLPPEYAFHQATWLKLNED